VLKIASADAGDQKSLGAKGAGFGLRILAKSTLRNIEGNGAGIDRGHNLPMACPPIRYSQYARAWRPFDGFPYAGLLELIRDLINYGYRDFAK
jgi:hypothetical protein